MGFEFTPWVPSGLFCVLVSAFSLWVVIGAFCVLESSSFFLSLERLLRDWAGQLGSCAFFLVLQTPRSVLGPGWSYFSRQFAFPGWSYYARPFAFLPSRRPPHSIRGHGLGNRAAKHRHGTVGFSCSFSCVVLPKSSSAPSRGAARVIWLFTRWHRTACFVFFLLL